MENKIENRNLFRESIRIALEEWDSLQSAIDHGMGGEYVNEKVDWMIDVIRQYFIDTRNSFDFDDAINYVEEIMDKEFDTLIEDESTNLLIRKIMKFFNLNNEEKYDELRDLLNEKQNKLNETKDSRMKKREEIKLKEKLDNLEVISESDSNDDDDIDDSNEMKIDNRAKTDEDGWTKF